VTDGATGAVIDAPDTSGSGKKVRTMRIPRRMRNLELALLIIVWLISASALVLVQLGSLGTIDPTFMTFSAGLCALTLAMHIVMRFVAPEADPFILPIATLLNGIGIAGIYRVDIAEADTGWDAVAVRQMMWTAIAIGCAVTVLLLVRNHRILQRYTYIAMFVGVLLLLLPMLPGLGQQINGARVWISFAGFTFQPGEVAKIALAVFFAGYLVTRRDSLAIVGKKFMGMQLPRGRDLGPIVVIWLLAMSVIVFQRDLGTALLYFGLFLVMIYVATGRFSWVAIGLTLFAGGALVASQTLDYVNGRMMNWLDAFNPDIYGAQGGSYQLVQGLFGLANGGIFGTGLGQGRPDLTPVAQSDYIIASLGEELGITGIFCILALYLLFVSRGLRIGFAGQDDFGKLLAVGLAFVIALQCFIVIGGVTRVIPLTGLTTPFLAAGGSALIANWIIAALLLRVSDSVRTQPRIVV